MSEAVLAALITGMLSLTGVLITLASRRARAGEVRRLRDELGQAHGTVMQARAEAEKYRVAYLGLLELMQELLRETSG